MDEDRLKHFEESWRAWAQRPTELSAQQAARQVGARLSRRTRWHERHRTLLAAAALLLVCFALATQLHVPGSSPEAPTPQALGPAGTALSEGQALIWLDERTPLYMTFSAPQGSTSPGGLP